ncbi:hypothetical protein [Vibrio owensii]|uniref:hypothetical protein n=1 Tax=Vibrio owensii TaxID=696485 RepID=UPI003CC674C1
MTMLKANSTLLRLDDEYRKVLTGWTNTGLYAELNNAIDELIPKTGKSDLEAVNAFMVVNEMYYDHFNNGGGNEGRWGNNVEFRKHLKDADIDPDAKKEISKQFTVVHNMTGKYGCTKSNEGYKFDREIEILMDAILTQTLRKTHPGLVEKVEEQYHMAKTDGVYITKGNRKCSVFVGDSLPECTVVMPLRDIAAKGKNGLAELHKELRLYEEAVNYISMAFSHDGITFWEQVSKSISDDNNQFNSHSESIKPPEGEEFDFNSLEVSLTRADKSKKAVTSIHDLCVAYSNVRSAYYAATKNIPYSQKQEFVSELDKAFKPREKAVELDFSL